MTTYPNQRRALEQLQSDAQMLLWKLQGRDLEVSGTYDEESLQSVINRILSMNLDRFEGDINKDYAGWHEDARLKMSDGLWKLLRRELTRAW